MFKFKSISTSRSSLEEDFTVNDRSKLIMKTLINKVAKTDPKNDEKNKIIKEKFTETN